MANKGLFGIYCSESRANSASNYTAALDKDLYLSLSEMGKVVSITNNNSYKVFLPDARQISYSNSRITIVNKHATNYIEVRSNGNYLIKVIPPISSQTFTNVSKTTAAGEWSTTNNTTPLTQIAVVSETTLRNSVAGDPSIIMLTDTLGIMTYIVQSSGVYGQMFTVSAIGVVTTGASFLIYTTGNPSYIQNSCKLTNSSIVIVSRRAGDTYLGVIYLWGLTSLSSTGSNVTSTLGITLYDTVEIRVYTVSPTVIIVVSQVNLTNIYWSSYRITPETLITNVTNLNFGVIEGRLAVLSTTRAIIIYKDNPRKTHSAQLISIAADGTIARVGSVIGIATMTVDRPGSDIVALNSTTAVGLDIYSSNGTDFKYTWFKFTVAADVLSIVRLDDSITVTGEYFRMALLSNGNVLLVRGTTNTIPQPLGAELITYQTNGTYVSKTTQVPIRASADVNNNYNNPSIAVIDNARVAVLYQCTSNDANTNIAILTLY